MPRPRIVPLIAVALLLAVAGCTEPTQQQREVQAQQRVVEWLGEQDGVASAEVEPDPDDPEGEQIRVETTPGLPDADVGTLYDGLAEQLNVRGGHTVSVLLSVDGFEAPAYGFTGRPFLETALWLRRDGRAESAVLGGYPDYVITAPPCEVFGLTLAYDQEAGEQSRTTREVRSADGTARVQWTRSDELEMALPRGAVSQLSQLCRAYPGTRGWVEGTAGRFDEITGAVLLDPSDLSLDEVVQGADTLVDAADFPRGLTLGWDGLRAGAGSFSEVFTGDRRALAEAMLEAGADRVLGTDEVEPGGDEVTIKQVQVSDLESWGAVNEVLTAGDGDEQYFSVDLFREPPEESRTVSADEVYGGYGPTRAGSPAGELVRDTYPVQEVWQVSLYPAVRIIGSDQISEEDLRQVMQASKTAYGTIDEEVVQDRIQAEFWAGPTDPDGTRRPERIGIVVDNVFRPDTQVEIEEPELVQRFVDAWEQVG